MSFRSQQSFERVSRRSFLAATIVAANCTGSSARGAVEPADPDCRRCGGVGRVPLLDYKPLVWLKGTPLPKWETAIGEQYCPVCQVGADSRVLVAELKASFDGAVAANKEWEERTGWKLACVVTRHAAIHTQLNTAQCRVVGSALETCLTHIKRVTGSLLLARTRPEGYGLVFLWEKTSWESFRKVLESQYSLEQLGPSWTSAREYNAYDHFAAPHLYETPQTTKTRPPSCGAVFMTARRQIELAADWRAPYWLAEGFAAYGDNVVHKLNRWYTVYSPRQIPVADWLVEARKLAGDNKHQPWNKMVQREMRDWETNDNVQTMSMVAFLFEAEPAKFLNYVNRLRNREEQTPALEEAYEAPLDQLEQRWKKWIAARR